MAPQRAWVALAAVCLSLGACGAWLEDLSLGDASLLEEFKSRAVFARFVEHHAREYAQDVKELEHRFQVFWENMKFIAEHNQKGKSFQVGMNHMADMTLEEVHSQRMGFRVSAKRSPVPGPNDHIADSLNPFPRSTPGHTDCTYRLRNVKPPKAVDWREVGVVGPVKDQQGCGSCWAFATTSTVESLNAIHTGQLTVLSEQFPTDCNWMSNPCQGGNMEEGYKWMVANGAVTLEDYPYNEGKKNATCTVKKWYNAPKVTVDTYEMIPTGEENLKKAVAISPVSVGVDASHKEFLFYKSGIFDHLPCNDTELGLTHAITAVGYGEEDGVGYWIVRNQWNTNWGDNGYIKMAMGKGDFGICGIARLASRPVMDGETMFHLFSHLPEWAMEARRQVAMNNSTKTENPSAMGLTSSGGGISSAARKFLA